MEFSRLRQGKYKLKYRHLILPESKKTLNDQPDQIKMTERSPQEIPTDQTWDNLSIKKNRIMIPRESRKN